MQRCATGHGGCVAFHIGWIDPLQTEEIWAAKWTPRLVFADGIATQMGGFSLCSEKEMKRSDVVRVKEKHRFIMCIVRNVAKQTQGDEAQDHEVPCHSSLG